MSHALIWTELNPNNISAELTHEVPFAGFGTIVGLILSGFSLVLLSMGIIALYVASIYEEVKNRPLYLIAESTDNV